MGKVDLNSVAAEEVRFLAEFKGDRARVFGFGMKILEPKVGALAEPEKSVSAADMVGVAPAGPAGVKEAEGGAFADIVAVAEDSSGHVLIERGRAGALVGGENQVIDPVPGGKEADGAAAGFPGELCPPHGIGNRPGEYSLERRQEEIAPFKEEGPLLRIVEGKTRVHIELGDIGLHLGEIRVGRGVEDHIGSHSPLGRNPGFRLDTARLEPS